MTETTNTPATLIIYSEIDRIVTIVFRDGTRVVVPLHEPWGDKLVSLMWSRAAPESSQSSRRERALI